MKEKKTKAENNELRDRTENTGIWILDQQRIDGSLANTMFKQIYMWEKNLYIYTNTKGILQYYKKSGWNGLF